ncbi:NAD(+) diphosphatase [Nocardioides perillae]|uniref:NAD(+) diphosphatase n=1 Tax=Nocardioides perillae TaxID=1119534 RepID=A0A7Y9RRZ6_9ACTN|nr:NAD+ diphosphatase [Nocardioides perillae]
MPTPDPTPRPPAPASPRTLPHVALSQHAHDRHGAHRSDEAWHAARWADPTTRVLVLAGSRLRVVDGRVAWTTPAEAPAGTRLLLGERDGTTAYAVVVDPADAPGPREEWVVLRAALQHVADPADPDAARDAPLVLHAVGLAEWLWATRHCPRCGGALEVRKAGHEQVCTACGKPQFPRTDPAVIMLVAHGEPGSDDERCLLGRSPAWPPGRYSTLAGFVEPGETMEDAVRREVHEETGVLVGAVDYFGSQPWPLPASLMVGFTARASSTAVAVDGEEVEDARWWTRDELRAEAESGALVLPGGVSISRSLIEGWYGGPLPGQW